MANQKNNVGVVWQVFLTSDEEQKLKDILEIKGLPPTKEGLKSFIFNRIEKVDEEPKLSPEAEDLIYKGMGFVGKMIKKKAGL
jgi:hypothetical protein